MNGRRVLSTRRPSAAMTEVLPADELPIPRRTARCGGRASGRADRAPVAESVRRAGAVAGAELVHPPEVEGRWRRTPARPDPVHGRRDGAACGRGVKRDGRCCCTESCAGAHSSRAGRERAGRAREGRARRWGRDAAAPVVRCRSAPRDGRPGGRPPTITVTRRDGGAGRGSSAPPPYPAAMIASNSSLQLLPLRHAVRRSRRRAGPCTQAGRPARTRRWPGRWGRGRGGGG